MDPFLLSIDHRHDGFTHITYDIGPSNRANILAPTITAHETISVRPIDLLGYTLSATRPPTTPRRTAR